jgi:hypothetical protein
MQLKGRAFRPGDGMVIISAIGSLFIGNMPRVLADPPDIHGMLIVGEKTVYLSHLSMPPPSHHRFQAIFEAELPNQKAYTSDRSANPNQLIYTINPAPFVLEKLNPNLGQAFAKSFPVRTIERGHFEKIEPNEKILVKSGIVNIKRVLLFRQYEQGARPIKQLRYLLFGKNGELFLAHIINGSPDFDHVLTASSVSPSPSEAELNAGLIVEIDNRTNTIRHRLIDSLTVNGEAINTEDGRRRTMQIASGRTLYLEEGELSSPPNYKTTDEERRARFP